MQTKLPRILQKEPLVDAVFEVRLQGTSQLADILPGFLLREFDPKPKITRLPAADLPQPVRANDPSLRFTPVQRLDLGPYLISVGDQNVVISCKLPYPKWPNFKAAILDIIGRIDAAGIEGQVDRYSVKYVNLIEAPTFADQFQKIRMTILLGDVEVNDDHISLKVHRKEGDIIHIMSVVTGAQGAMPDGRHVFGAVVDIDSIREIDAQSFTDFAAGLEQGVEELRQANKVKFFSCLTDATIEEMGPIYE